MKHFIVATFLAVAMFGSYMIFQHRDLVFYWDFAEPAGELRFEREPILTDAIDAFLRANNDGSHGVCVSQWFGRDDLYLYTKVLCDDFREEDGRVVRAGQGQFLPTRFEYDPTTNTVQSMEVAVPNEFGSLRTLFPKPVYSIMRYYNEPSEEILREGLKKSAEQSELLEPEM